MISSYEKSFTSIQTLLTNADAQKYKIPIENLEFGHVVGKGAFGVVIYAEIKANNDENLNNKKPVAIKKLRGTYGTIETKKNLIFFLNR